MISPKTNINNSNMIKENIDILAESSEKCDSKKKSESESESNGEKEEEENERKEYKRIKKKFIEKYHIIFDSRVRYNLLKLMEENESNMPKEDIIDFCVIYDILSVKCHLKRK